MSYISHINYISYVSYMSYISRCFMNHLKNTWHQLKIARIAFKAIFFVSKSFVLIIYKNGKLKTFKL